ncbi:unnamed protein product [Lepeophtheirus salmonis]|uniref:(salmon louse) hypothetical protein n=1 Tax=Lepeophtheirus salmonis TaxID=72036 RepID=A0A7R8D553_LEPSM|nr:unnamed protein product [Lepeophtheirus salmonis]CAF3031590.1 unnamed protein product [Lepeophtheirus salmonis]
MHTNSCVARVRYLKKCGLPNTHPTPRFTINNSDTESESNSMMCLQCDHLFDMKIDLEAHRIAHHSEDIYNNEIYGESDGEEIESEVLNNLDEGLSLTHESLHQVSYEEFVLDSERTQEPEQIVLQTVPQPPSNIKDKGSLYAPPV